MDVGSFIDAILIGFVVTTVFSLIAGFFKLFFMFRKQMYAEQTGTIIDKGMIKEYDKAVFVVLTMEEVEHDGKPLFLVYEAVKKSFVCQGRTAEEIADRIAGRFLDKDVILANGDEMITLRKRGAV